MNDKIQLTISLVSVTYAFWTYLWAKNRVRNARQLLEECKEHLKASKDTEQKALQILNQAHKISGPRQPL